VIGHDQPFCIIGERINPTGRKIFQEQLRAGDLSRIEIDVAQQAAGGAMVLDINMGAPLADEVDLMIQAVKLVQSISDLPLCIDSSVIEELARKIVDVATSEYGIAIEDILLDPLAMPIGADTSLVVKTLETISLISSELGVNMTLGASNVSFGMPDRTTIGAGFLSMAMKVGLTSAIMDARTPQLVRAIKAADLLLDRDPWGASWIAAHRAQQAAGGS
jgi:5-methyltetrahydrofolate--homocysteine methyltransferase